MPLKVIAFDWGHTLMDEQRDSGIAVGRRPIHLMPGVAAVLPQLALPLAVWANTRESSGAVGQQWLNRAGLSLHFRWVATSVDAGARKPARAFFDYALAQCGLAGHEVLFVGNQLNTDITGGNAYGIQTVWFSADAYRSDDGAPCEASATCTIDWLYELPRLVQRISTFASSTPEL